MTDHFFWPNSRCDIIFYGFINYDNQLVIDSYRRCRSFHKNNSYLGHNCRIPAGVPPVVSRRCQAPDGGNHPQGSHFETGRTIQVSGILLNLPR